MPHTLIHTPKGVAMIGRIDEIEKEEQTSISQLLAAADKVVLADTSPRPKLPVIKDHLTNAYSERVRAAQAKLDSAIGAAIDEFIAERAEAAITLELAMSQRDKEYVEGRKET